MAIETSQEPEIFGDFEHQGWERSSAGYDRHWARLTCQSAPATLDAAGVVEGASVLDVCCGPGLLAAAALERGARVVGLDFSDNAIAIARAKVPDGEFRQGDAQALPFEDGSFDAAVCGFGIIHVPNPERALSEMRRVLRPGGRLAVSVWNQPNPGNGMGVLFGALKAHGDLTVPLPHGPDFFQFSSEDSLSGALETTGLRDISVAVVDQTWRIDEALGIVRAVLEGAVRARALLLAQTEEARAAIDAAVVAGMSRFRTDEGVYQVPMPALVGAGTA